MQISLRKTGKLFGIRFFLTLKEKQHCICWRAFDLSILLM